MTRKSLLTTTTSPSRECTAQYPPRPAARIRTATRHTAKTRQHVPQSTPRCRATTRIPVMSPTAPVLCALQASASSSALDFSALRTIKVSRIFCAPIVFSAQCLPDTRMNSLSTRCGLVGCSARACSNARATKTPRLVQLKTVQLTQPTTPMSLPPTRLPSPLTADTSQRWKPTRRTSYERLDERNHSLSRTLSPGDDAPAQRVSRGGAAGGGGGQGMSRLDAVVRVLKSTGKALHYDVITKQALHQGIIRFTGSQGTAGESMKVFFSLLFFSCWGVDEVFFSLLFLLLMSR